MGMEPVDQVAAGTQLTDLAGTERTVHTNANQSPTKRICVPRIIASCSGVGLLGSLERLLTFILGEFDGDAGDGVKALGFVPFVGRVIVEPSQKTE